MGNKITSKIVNPKPMPDQKLKDVEKIVKILRRNIEQIKTGIIKCNTKK